MDDLPTGCRMGLAFLLSMDALKLFRAGLRAQGISEPDVRDRMGMGSFQSLITKGGAAEQRTATK